MAYPQEDMARQIFELRGQRVMLDSDLARLYGVPTRTLNQAVSRIYVAFRQTSCFELLLLKKRL